MKKTKHLPKIIFRKNNQAWENRSFPMPDQPVFDYSALTVDRISAILAKVHFSRGGHTMLIESIGYTAMLVDYIARATHLPVAVIAETIGEVGIFRLAHNAPMNRHLPITQISSEVISDYSISCKSPNFTVRPDEAVSATVISEVQDITSQKNLYTYVLYELLTSRNS